MHRVEVHSSNVASVGYDEDTHTLEVAFAAKRGKPESVYQYTGVPPQAWHGLLHSPTKGGYLSEHIKGVYPVEKIQ